eukprot:m.454160 g.454160  ORF g.454160 m.454160 type:complete len:304 (-) comp56947_c0_seq1:3187-4098(-)
MASRRSADFSEFQPEIVPLPPRSLLPSPGASQPTLLSPSRQSSTSSVSSPTAPAPSLSAAIPVVPRPPTTPQRSHSMASRPRSSSQLPPVTASYLRVSPQSARAPPSSTSTPTHPAAATAAAAAVVALADPPFSTSPGGTRRSRQLPRTPAPTRAPEPPEPPELPTPIDPVALAFTLDDIHNNPFFDLSSPATAEKPPATRPSSAAVAAVTETLRSVELQGSRFTESQCDENPPPLPPRLYSSQRVTERWRSECVICLDAPCDAVILPCWHLIMCWSCCESTAPRLCPICRRQVTESHRVFLA